MAKGGRGNKNISVMGGGGISAPEKWDFRGIRESIDNLENRLNNTKSQNTISNIYRSLRAQDDIITNYINEGEGSQSALLTQRRRVRQMLKKIKGGRL